MKKLISLFLSFFMMVSLVACGGKSNEEVKETKEEAKVNTVMENEIVRVKLVNPEKMDNGFYRYVTEIENLSDQDIILLSGRTIGPGEKEGVGIDFEPADVYTDTVVIRDTNNYVLCEIEYEVSFNEELEFTKVSILRNEILESNKGLSEDAITIEQIGDSVVDIYAKDECGDFYRTLLTVRITNNTDTKLMVFVGYKEIVLEPGETVEKEIEAMDDVPGNYEFACTAAKDLPFDLDVSFVAFEDGTDPYMQEQTHTTFTVTH